MLPCEGLLVYVENSFITFYFRTCYILHVVLISLSDLTIHKLFATRADLHRTVYTHAKVKVPNPTYIVNMELQNSSCSIDVFNLYLNTKCINLTVILLSGNRTHGC
jgi:hypothetical protein